MSGPRGSEPCDAYRAGDLRGRTEGWERDPVQRARSPITFSCRCGKRLAMADDYDACVTCSCGQLTQWYQVGPWR